jgi:endonuclease YncB( thermonuclease family)
MGNAGARCAACASCYTCCDPELEAGAKGKDFTLEGRRFRAKVVEVYDGDTLRVKFRLHGKILQMKVRMAGYDSPEMKPLRSAPHREEEKKAAIAARDALFERIGDQMVYIHCGGFDKYGRLLATVRKPCGFLGLKDGFDINKWMIAEKHGVPYDGGTKKPFIPEGHEEPAEHERAHSSSRAIVNPRVRAARIGNSASHSSALPKGATADKPAAKAIADSHESVAGGALPTISEVEHTAELAKKTRKTPDAEMIGAEYIQVDQPSDANEIYQVSPSPDSL